MFKKIKGFYDNGPKNKVIFWITTALALISFIIFTPYLNGNSISDYLFESPKVLEISVANMYSLNEIPYKTNGVLLMQGCKTRVLLFISNINISEGARGDISPFVYTTINREKCLKCTYHFVNIRNKGKYIAEQVIFSVDLTNNFIVDGKDSKLEVIPSNMPEKNNLIVKIIGGFEGNKSEILVFKGYTNEYTPLDFNCENIKNSKCDFIQYDIGDIRNQTKINLFFSKQKIIPPEYVEEMKAYFLNWDNNQFEEYPLMGNLFYSYFEEECKIGN